MKKLILILLLSPMVVLAQSFEGKVTYALSYTSKLPNVNDQQLASMLGTVENWYIKGGNYKAEMNGTYAQWQIYVNKENKIYSKMANAKTPSITDAASSENEVTGAEVHRGVTQVLGYPCDEVVLTTKQGVEKYYFSSLLPMDSKFFVNHKFGEWNAYLDKAHAVPLKMVVEIPGMVVEGVATAVTPMKLNDSFFQVPTN